jgi:hypothetical protein
MKRSVVATKTLFTDLAPLCVIPEGAGPVNCAGSVGMASLLFSDAVWVNASEAWGSRIGRRPIAKRP